MRQGSGAAKEAPQRRTASGSGLSWLVKAHPTREAGSLAKEKANNKKLIVWDWYRFWLCI